MNEQLSFSFEIKTDIRKNETFVGEINSWKDFENSLKSLSNKEKGDAFENLVKIYFKLNPLYNFYDNVWMWSEVPHRDLENLELPSHDLGIDLIAKFGDEYHAIQCKYHSDKTSSVTFKETSTFISLLESNTKITQGYICSSADLTSRNFNMLKTKPINLIMSDNWKKLDEEFFKQSRKFQEGKRPALKAFKPFEHQEKAIEEAEDYFQTRNHNRGKLIFPCGAGKSLTGYWISQRLSSTSTIIAVPSLSLVKQTLEVYLKEIVAEGRQVKWLCICSDDGIGKNDDVVYYTENLGVPCHTNPKYIEEWLIKNQREEIIIFTTYQSGRIIAEITKRLNFTFDVGIFDEAHKTVGAGKKLFGHLLFQENIQIDKRIFMTATERFYKGSRDDIVSMDDEDVYGETFSYMSFKKAIEEGLLTDYKVVTIDVRKSEIANFIKQNHLIQLNDKWKKETEARSLASMIALRKAMTRFPIKKAVSFHTSIEKAERNKELQHYLTSHYSFAPIDTYTVSGKQSTTKRNNIVQEFSSSSKGLITNARCLTEGVDVPSIDCIVFADPKKSKVDIVQALGRALRKKEGKEWGYVILPVVYDDVTHEIDNENFTEIISIIRGLAANDERIVEYFRDQNTGSGPGVRKEKLEQFNFEVFTEYINEAEITKELEIKLWEKLSRFNWRPFEEAKTYVQSLGLKTQEDWKDYCKSGLKPPDIPYTPDKVYEEKGWTNLGDWLGTGNIATRDLIFKPYDEAQAFVENLQITSAKQWKSVCKSGLIPDNIPKNPQTTYKRSGWKNWGEWLGTKAIANYHIKYRTFFEAAKFSRNLNLRSSNEWRKYCKSGKKPDDIPGSPYNTYRITGWENWGHWLGTGKTSDNSRQYRNFFDAKNFVHGLKLENANEWRKYCANGNKPENIPSAPYNTYKTEGWIDWGDWLGTGRISANKREFLNYIEAESFVRNLNLKSSQEWSNYCKSGEKPERIPSTPARVYKNKGWKGMGEWLGTGTIAPQNLGFRTYSEARRFASILGLNSSSEWFQYCKSGNKPDDIPTAANGIYKNKGWNGWGDFLGTGKTSPHYIDYLSFEKAKLLVSQLGLKSSTDWIKYCKSGAKPHNIPAAVSIYYKDKGWNGWPDFLGKKDN